ncbi:head-tail connector protein [Rubellimicrobium arenae]|uniref:head-tail connector protein n=1 Tax=Rubellimicrobium arenae TaxID=2817372 RepID=UPI001B309D6B|nr:head-tail connector protein [Rubellimicrobium arenae]
MTVRSWRVTEPEPAITLENAKRAIRATDDEDPLILSLIAAASERVEILTGRAFGPQTWEVISAGFPSGGIEYEWGPLVSVTSIEYLRADGTTGSVPLDDLDVVEASDCGFVRTLSTWPAARTSANAVRMRYVAGRGWTDTTRQAVRLLVGHWFKNREAVGDAQAELPLGASALIASVRRIAV